MSRCFVIPPRGCSGVEGRRGQALIESIKLLGSEQLSKAEAKKDRKREKKVKKEKLMSSLLPEKKIHKRSSSGLKIRSLQKLIQSENEQLERSSLTEEHAQPVGEQKPSTSSDSTQNSSKRKREASPPAVFKQEEPSIRAKGNVIRIRLSSQKRNAPVIRQEPCSTNSEKGELPSQEQNVVSRRQEPCSTSGRSELATSNKCQGNKDPVSSSVQQRNINIVSVHLPRPELNKVGSTPVLKSFIREDNVAVVSLSSLNKETRPLRPHGEIHSNLRVPDNKLALPPRPNRESPSTSSGPKEITHEDDILVRDPKSLNKKLVNAAAKYSDLFLNWVPPPSQSNLEHDDHDWLFSKKKTPDNQSEKRVKPNIDLSCGNNTSLWPRARLIPEVDIYALPFTLPF